MNTLFGEFPSFSKDTIINNNNNYLDLIDAQDFMSFPASSPPPPVQNSDDSAPSPGASSEGGGGFSDDDGQSPNTMLKFIGEMLMEEEESLEDQPCMLQNCLALQAAEKSLYDVLGQDYPYPLQNTLQFSDYHSPSSDYSNNSPSSTHSVTNPNNSPDGSRKKNRMREVEDGFEWRSNKQQSASFLSGPSEEFDPQLLDNVLLCGAEETGPCPKEETESPKNRRRRGAKKGAAKKGGATATGSSGEIVDLWTLLTQCSQSVATNDQRTSNELLAQIRQHSSPHGDGMQRTAYYMANALETRLAGASTPAYTLLVSSNVSAADMLHSYQVYIKACPFKIMSNTYANRSIMKQAENATALHIIDFGILYGFQWPCLIERISKRSNGPPKIRITGIELPQPGFRPAERVEETGRRLQNYCRRFGVPFEYHAVAKKWETITYEDLMIDSNRDEMVVVNCLYRLKNIPDETVSASSPRDTVLRLIRRIKPDLFVHGVLNGTYNAPFFVTRFKEALFHFSTLFDMFEVNIPREDEKRLMFEKGIFAKDVMNVIACEGSERVERPETYKQWHTRNTRAGLRPVPIDKDLFSVLRNKVRNGYHKDFVIHEDGQWMLQGWKGRLIYAISCWRSA